jgi:hypothetical protein
MIDRSAASAIRGYRYQFFRTLLAWIELEPNEKLTIDDEEDYAIDGGNDKYFYQIKDVTSQNISLRSKSARQAIEQLWIYHKRYKNVFLIFSTTAKAAKEVGAADYFTSSGIEICANVSSTQNKALAEQLRHFMLNELDFDGEFLNYLRNISVDKLISDLILRIGWDVNAMSLQDVRTQIKFKLVRIGRRRGVGYRESIRTMDQLLETVSTRAAANFDKQVDYDDLIHIFEEITDIDLPNANYQNSFSLLRDMKLAPFLPIFICAIIFMTYGPSTTVLAMCLATMVVFFHFLRLFHVIGQGDSVDEIERKNYSKLRKVLRRGSFVAQLYRSISKKLLRCVDDFFQDGRLVSYGWPLPILRRKAAIWTGPAFDRCILIAIIYPLSSLMVFWSIDGEVGQSQFVLRLPEIHDRWRLFILAVAAVSEIIAIWKIMTTRSWTSALWAVTGGAWAMSLSIAAAGVPRVAVVFGSVALASGVTALVGSRVRNWRALQRTTDSGTVSGLAAILAINAGCLVFSEVGKIDQYVAGALAGATTVFMMVLGTVLTKRWREENNALALCFLWLLALLLTLTVARQIEGLQETWGKAGPMLLFLAWLPLINAPFDWLSLGLTRLLMHRGIELKGWWPFLFALIDAIVGCGLGCSAGSDPYVRQPSV